MKGALSVAAVAAVASSALASDILRRAVPGNKVVSMDFVKEKRFLDAPGAVSRPKNRRRGTITESLDNAELLYYADVTVGSPGQKVRLQIDTGSSDVWVESAASSFCSSSENPCQTGGTFDSSKSSTFSVVDQGGFSIGYADNTAASGDYFTDNFGIGGKTIKTLQMGIATQTNISEGIMGIGYDNNEATQNTYPSIVDQMVTQKFINSKAYSLWLNDQESNTGSVLFGGIDTAKYVGNLTGLALQTEQGQTSPNEFLVVLSAVSVTPAGKSTSGTSGDLNLGVVLDSGSSLMLLPDKIVKGLVSEFGGSYSSDFQIYLVPCSLMNDVTSYVSFTFGGQSGVTIQVLAEELAQYVIGTDGSILTDNSGDKICQFGIQSQPDGSDIYLFGDTFLRSAYVVYDLDGQMVYLAQTVFNTSNSNVMEIQASTDTNSGVPDVSGVASGVSIKPTATGTQIPREGTSAPTGTGTATGHSAAVRIVPLDIMIFVPVVMTVFGLFCGAVLL